MSELAIRLEGISKRYRIGALRGRHDTLRDAIMDRVRRIRRRGADREADETLWALRDVTFDVNQGDTVGLIGRNGAGKSTLLKILSRITEPTSGRGEIHGRVGSLLEVGTGFNQELTGRENIYLSGAILGMRKAEIDRNFDEIVAFSEVGRFIDTPVKRYSSGMHVRLGFAVAAHLEPEVMFVDEVLAVGDATFQRKCLGKMQDVSKKGRTVVFVSHNMAAVTRLCRIGVWIDAGRVRQIGPASDVAMAYLEEGQANLAEAVFTNGTNPAPGSDVVRLRSARVCDQHGRVTSVFRARDSQTLEIEYEILRATQSLRFGLTLVTQDGTVVLHSHDTGLVGTERLPGTYVAVCNLPAAFLCKGSFAFTLGCDTPRVQSHFRVERAVGFRIENVVEEGDEAVEGPVGLVKIPIAWTTERVQ